MKGHRIFHLPAAATKGQRAHILTEAMRSQLHSNLTTVFLGGTPEYRKKVRADFKQARADIQFKKAKRDTA